MVRRFRPISAQSDSMPWGHVSRDGLKRLLRRGINRRRQDAARATGTEVCLGRTCDVMTRKRCPLIAETRRMDFQTWQS